MKDKQEYDSSHPYEINEENNIHPDRINEKTIQHRLDIWFVSIGYNVLVMMSTGKKTN
ncbi:MAG: hypothetical protein HUJ53_01675 [Holdemanella sp.]|nr:hypothetical protein [Holdemanella sp.]